MTGKKNLPVACFQDGLLLRKINVQGCRVRFRLVLSGIKKPFFSSLRIFCSRFPKTSAIPGTSRSDYFQTPPKAEETSGELTVTQVFHNGENEGKETREFRFVTLNVMFLSKCPSVSLCRRESRCLQGFTALNGSSSVSLTG